MRILMTVSSTSLMDGIGRHILAVAPELNAVDGIEVAVMTLWKRGELNAALEEKGVKTYSLNCPNGHAVAALWRTAAVIRDFRPDVVHHHVMGCFSQICLAQRFPRIKYVLTRHGVSDKVTHIPFKDRVNAWLLKLGRLRYAAVCYVSKGVKDYFVDELKIDGSSLQYVAYNPVSFDRSFAGKGVLRRMLNVPEGTPVVGTACRFARQKNPLAFVGVIGRVLSKNPKAHAVLLGDGTDEMKAAMKSRADSFGKDVADRIHFLGYRPDAVDLVHEFSCFVMTSDWEGLPTSLLEAMSAHTPIAFFNGLGGMIDLFRLNKDVGPFAAVAEAGDEVTLADGVCSFLDDPSMAERYADLAFEVGRSNFDLPAVVDQLSRVYKDVLMAT